MPNRLFLLDSMALLYRAHFALIKKPIFNSKGVNTSALYGFANVLLDIRENQKPTHLSAAFDTSAPTPRHTMFAEYKAQREEMPEDLSLAIPAAKRLLKAMRIPILELDGYEADDLIGTLAHQAEGRGDFETYMVTPDKDFGQLVTERTKIYKPGRQGSDTEILGVKEICERWGVQNPEQVIDILGLMGDASDNIPGIKGVGEKTAAKLIQQFGGVEAMLERVDEIEGKLKDKVKEGAAMARLSRQLAVIMRDAPAPVGLDEMALQSFDDDALKAIFVEYEFNALGRRIFGEDFKAGRGGAAAPAQPTKKTSAKAKSAAGGDAQGDLFGGGGTTAEAPTTIPTELEANEQELFDAPTNPNLQTAATVPHKYDLVTTREDRERWLKRLAEVKAFCFDTETDGLDPLTARMLGMSFAIDPHEACYIHIPEDPQEHLAVLAELKPLLTTSTAEKIGHNLKFDLRVLMAHKIEVAGPFFDTMLAHSLIEPDQRHGMDYLSERYLGYSPISITTLIGEKKGPTPQKSMAEVPLEPLAEYAAEDADVTLQLATILRPELEKQGQHKVFYDIEAPLLPVLVRMEHVGVTVDAPTLNEIGHTLEQRARELEARIHSYAGAPFNLNSPKKLGEVLFDQLRLIEKPKKTATGQYQTNEQTLQSLVGVHPIIEDILAYRESTKLKNTYVDALPATVNPIDGRVHTTFHQLMAATGRMASSDPNLQNIPIRSDAGREIRKAFVPEKEDWVLLSADYSQIELRVMAALSGDDNMAEAFQRKLDIHTATAAKVYNVPLEETTSDMRRTAKMVNFGIIYGISAFGLSQRLGIPRAEAGQIIDSYFVQYPGVREYMDREVEDARKRGFVSTLTGRRRFLRDINSSNATVRNATERVAMNTPIQGTAADMIKLAMITVDRLLHEGGFKTRMLLQVHDELLFEVPNSEVEKVTPIIVESMQHALPLRVPVLVETGTGKNWLEAH
ncbi:DNA polymerase I [Roseimicrobium sp. ORNL1]|uniref:DNA polymerase I n=1 Tax=Roseimicrobium sp. ORNL1 TaxID=2711231 RepID=UPI0013E1A611|nr:DNA polymerase I [Roseimicrobium sp. ORNL1]QIF03364.1 DNA polymerase I [Roseimicrobium sp. ORNL1]